MNTRNFGTLTGRLTRNPKLSDNKDGSKRAFVTLAVPRNYKNAEGKTDSDFIDVNGFVPAGKGAGRFAYMAQGDLVQVSYTMKSSTFTKDGETQYRQELAIEDISLLESKAVTDARKAKVAAGGAPEEDAAPVMPEDDAVETPFTPDAKA